MAVNYAETMSGVFSGTFAKMGSLWWLFAIIGLLIVVGVIAYVAITFKRTNKKWSIKIRIRQEDTQNNKIYLEPFIIKARRITLSNGLKMNLLAKPILGKRLMPLLNYYTKPGEYDILLTADNRIFLITGIEGIDKKRKLLNVGIRYPGIDQDFDELNTDYAKLNQQDFKSSLLDILKAASIGILAICILIAVIIGGKYWLDGKQADTAISQAQIEIFEGLAKSAQYNLEFANAMNLLIPKLNEMYGTNNLRSQIVIEQQNDDGDIS